MPMHTMLLVVVRLQCVSDLKDVQELQGQEQGCHDVLRVLRCCWQVGYYKRGRQAWVVTEPATAPATMSPNVPASIVSTTSTSIKGSTSRRHTMTAAAIAELHRTPTHIAQSAAVKDHRCLPPAPPVAAKAFSNNNLRNGALLRVAINTCSACIHPVSHVTLCWY